MYKLSILLFILFHSTILSANCSFEKNAHLYKKEFAVRDATKKFIENRTVIYVVADGFGPSRPGLQSKTKITGCLLNEFWEKQVVLWTGADVIGSCENQTLAIERATEYALTHNEHLISLFKTSGHKCFAK